MMAAREVGKAASSCTTRHRGGMGEGLYRISATMTASRLGYLKLKVASGGSKPFNLCLQRAVAGRKLRVPRTFQPTTLPMAFPVPPPQAATASSR